MLISPQFGLSICSVVKENKFGAFDYQLYKVNLLELTLYRMSFGLHLLFIL